MKETGAWEVGDRLVNTVTGKQGQICRVDVSIMIAVVGGSIVLGKRATLEAFGWVLESRVQPQSFLK